MSGERTARKTRERGRRRYFSIWVITSVFILVALLAGLGYTGLSHADNKGVFKTAKLALGIQGSLNGVVMENYPGKPSAKDLKITVDGKNIDPVKPGFFAAKNLPTGAHMVVIKGKGYEKVVKRITIDKGINEESFNLSLTPVEAANRWMQTKKENKYEGTYSYLHPDEKARIEKASYIQYKSKMQKQYNILLKDFIVHTPRVVDTWKHPGTGKVYKDVAIMKVDGVITATHVAPIKKSWNVYAQDVKGQWMFLSAN
ncbi:MAG: peptidase associated/transthyretin-like domain-containing protein [Candidatus Aquicultor sp.]